MKVKLKDVRLPKTDEGEHQLKVTSRGKQQQSRGTSSRCGGEQVSSPHHVSHSLWHADPGLSCLAAITPVCVSYGNTFNSSRSFNHMQTHSPSLSHTHTPQNPHPPLHSPNKHAHIPTCIYAHFQTHIHSHANTPISLLQFNKYGDKIYFLTSSYLTLSAYCKHTHDKTC